MVFRDSPIEQEKTFFNKNCIKIYFDIILINYKHYARNNTKFH